MEFELEAGPTKKGARNISPEGDWAHQGPEGSVGIARLAPWQTWSLPFHGAFCLPGGSVSTQISVQCVLFLLR